MRDSRRGITLMEVLISIGVLSIGLLGLASLLPVARFFMADGSKYDHTAVMGQRALKELEIRTELMDPSNWFAPQGPAAFLSSPNGAFQEICPAKQTIGGFPYDGAYNYNWTVNSSIATIPATPAILDPLGCAYPDNLNANTNAGGGGTTQIAATGAYAPTFFPPSGYSLDGVGSPGSPALPRITIPRQNGVATVSGVRFASPMSFGQAAKIFQSTDDLIFNFPSDQSQRPTQGGPSVVLGGSTADVKYATSNGDYSWFAVVDNMQRPWNPGPDGAWGTLLDDNGDGALNDIGEAGWPGSDDIALWKTSGGELWHVWVVVVQKRNLQFVPASPSDIPPERMVYCDFTSAPSAATVALQNNAGLGGGDCVLSISNTQAVSGEWLTVKQNQWIMLSGWPAIPSKSGLLRGQLPRVQWFRIAAVGDIIATPDGWQRSVTLTGPDMNPYGFIDAIGKPAIAGLQFGSYQTLYATIVDGVSGVIEATIEQGQ